MLRVFKRFAVMTIPMTLCLFDVMHSIVGGGCFIGVCYYSITLPVVVPNEELGSVTTDTVQLVWLTSVEDSAVAKVVSLVQEVDRFSLLVSVVVENV